MDDYLRAYLMAGPWGRGSPLEALGHALVGHLRAQEGSGRTSLRSSEMPVREVR